ncbi:MAG TPA: hypothetical protein VK040_03965 [Balneolaceae bacterium]|nr:hypothetical protein [Balneolaceae bacterium]
MSLRPVLLLLLASVAISCTTSRWIVVDEQASESAETETILSEETVILPVGFPTPTHPVLTLEVKDVVEKEIVQQVVLERGIQQYRPKWGYWVAGLSAALFTGIAANTNLIHSGISDHAVVAFNLSALALSGFTLTQLEPVGEPIYTGERRLSRSSGFQQLTDTLSRKEEILDLPVALDIQYAGEVLHRSGQVRFVNGENSLNLAMMLTESGLPTQEGDVMEVSLRYNEQSFNFSYEIDELLVPYIEITEPVAVLRNAPVISDLNIVTEVGEGSVFELIGTGLDEEWYQVRFGGSILYVARSMAEITWRMAGTTGDIDVFEFADVEFGAVDVENAVPILKANDPGDRAIVFSNTYLEQPEIQRYTGRDHRLFEFYMSAAYQMRESQIAHIQIDSTETWRDQLSEFSDTDSTSVLYVYLSGKAHIDGDTIYMRTSVSDNQPMVPVPDLLQEFIRMNPEKLILLADLDYAEIETSSPGSSGARNGVAVQQQTAAALLREVPNAVIIFSSRPDQVSSLYAGRGSENKHHRIFMYYWADAIKKRNRTMHSVIRHLENNVDYTSRRLHDRPQEIQVFGNTTLNPVE